jgi:hypothetical protein
MIKVDSLRLLSVLLLSIAGMFLIMDIASHTRHETFPIVILLILSVALEKIRIELRDLRAELEKRRE